MHPNLKTGERSRYLGVLSPKMLARFEATENDPNLLSLAPEISLAVARLEELVERAEATGAGGRLWRDAQNAFEEFAGANERRDRSAALIALSKLGGLLRRGTTDYEVWEEAREERKLLVRLVESERKREIERLQVVQTVIVLRLLDALASSVKSRLKALGDSDLHDDILDGISGDIARLSSGLLGGTTETRS